MTMKLHGKILILRTGAGVTFLYERVSMGQFYDKGHAEAYACIDSQGTIWRHQKVIGKMEDLVYVN